MPRRTMPNHRNAIAWQLMQQQQRPQISAPPQMPPPQMGAMDKPMPTGSGAGTFGAPVAPSAPGMPHQLSASEWAMGSGDSSPQSYANYQGQNAPAYSGVGSLAAGPSGMNMASLSQPFQSAATPQPTSGPPLYPAGGIR